MNILQELEDFINEFNQNEEMDFSIDTIRAEFSKEHKMEALKKIGTWKKLGMNSDILHKLKKRLTDDGVTSAYRLEDYPIYYYNMQDKPKYRKAEMVIFGMKQYHKDPPTKELIVKILSILKNVSSIDVCSDLPYKPNYEALGKYFILTPYWTKDGVLTDTRYINDTSVMMLEKIIVYNKSYKNSLPYNLWRIEAKISIPNIRMLALPLHDFKEIINIGVSPQCKI